MTQENTKNNGTIETNEILWRPPNCPKIIETIRQYKVLQGWIHDKTNEKNISYGQDEYKRKISVSLIQSALDAADGIVCLIENLLPAPAMTLLRPMLEGHERLLWINNHASDQTINEIWTSKIFPKKSKLGKIINLNNSLDPKLQTPLRKVLNENMDFLNDFVHTNYSLVDSRLTADSVEPLFYQSTVIHTIELAKIVSASCAHQHSELFGIVSKVELTNVATKAGLVILEQ